jgi:hypothetical protein
LFLLSYLFLRLQYIPGAAEESDLIKVGDVVIGVSGVCVSGMDPLSINRVIAAARAVTPGGLVVLHLCDVPITSDLVEEASLQMSNAAAQLLQSRQVVELVQHAVYQAIVFQSLASSTGTAGYSSAVSTQVELPAAHASSYGLQIPSAFGQSGSSEGAGDIVMSGGR